MGIPLRRRFPSGFILNYYSRLVAKVPKLWVLPGTQLGVIAILITFWFLLQTGQEWVAVAFFFFGRQLLGIFLISQFWTARQRHLRAPASEETLRLHRRGSPARWRRLGATLTVLFVDRLGTTNLLLVSSGILAVSFFLVLMIQRRTRPDATTTRSRSRPTRSAVERRCPCSGNRATSRSSPSSSALARWARLDARESVLHGPGRSSWDQGHHHQIHCRDDDGQLFRGIRHSVCDAAHLQSLRGRIRAGDSPGQSRFVVRSRRLQQGALWASATARASDTTLRYSIDKTTREVLFLPLSAELKLKAKGFVDVVADRFIGKGIGSAILLVATKLLGAEWWHLSLIALVYAALWLPVTRLAKREYLSSFRRSIETLSLEPEELTPQSGDLATVETLVEELGSSDEQRVLRSIELLEALEKRNLITPLLLHHASPRVRSRALVAIQGARTELVERWLPSVELSLKDDDPDVRAAAVEVIASVHNGDVRRSDAALFER